jgi:predicted GNAT superfamily acetyltransferase
MQTIQLLGGAAGRSALLERVRAHLQPGGLLAAALSAQLPEYELADGLPVPLPDVCEREGTLYFSHPVGVYAEAQGYVLERRRERVSGSGERTVECDRVLLDHLEPLELEREGAALGLLADGRARIPATADYAGSEVVMLRA